jgi:TPR repeat protein
LIARADARDAEAMVELGDHYRLHGTLSVAPEWYRRAADLGHGWGKIELAFCYLRGDGIAADPSRASGLFRQVASLSSGRFFYHRVVDDGDDYPRTSDSAAVFARYALGMCYLLGRGVSQCKETATDLFESATFPGAVYGHENLWARYELGRLAAIDCPVRAMLHYQKGTFHETLVCTDALFAYGLCVMLRFGFPSRLTGPPPSDKHIGTHAHDRRGICPYIDRVPRSVDDVLQTAPDLAEYKDKDTRAVQYYFRRAAENGHPAAMYFRAICIQRGIGVPASPDGAIALLRQAAEAGHRSAMCELGICYLTGYGIAQDTAQAVAFFRRAVGAGDVTAMVELADVLRSGSEADKQEAWELYGAAAVRGDPSAEMFVALYSRYADPRVTVALCREDAELDPRDLFGHEAFFNDAFKIVGHFHWAMEWSRLSGAGARSFRRLDYVRNSDAVQSFRRLASLPGFSGGVVGTIAGFLPRDEWISLSVFANSDFFAALELAARSDSDYDVMTDYKLRFQHFGSSAVAPADESTLLRHDMQREFKERRSVRCQPPIRQGPYVHAMPMRRNGNRLREGAVSPTAPRADFLHYFSMPTDEYLNTHEQNPHAAQVSGARARVA